MTLSNQQDILKKGVWSDFLAEQFLVCKYRFTDVGNALPVIARPLKKAMAISDAAIEIAALGYASLAMTRADNFLSKTLLCTARKNSHTRKMYLDFLLLYILGYDPGFSIIGF